MSKQKHVNHAIPAVLSVMVIQIMTACHAQIRLKSYKVLNANQNAISAITQINTRFAKYAIRLAKNALLQEAQPVDRVIQAII